MATVNFTFNCNLVQIEVRNFSILQGTALDKPATYVILHSNSISCHYYCTFLPSSSIRFGILSPRSEAKALLIHRSPPCPLHPRGLYSVTGLGIRHASVARDIRFCTNILYQLHQVADKFHHCEYELCFYRTNVREDKHSYVLPKAHCAIPSNLL
jgi:hypothetical protein